MLRAQLAEFGVVLPHGIYHALGFAKNCLNGEQPDLPEVAGPKVAGDVIFELCDQLLFLHSKILRCNREMTQIAKREKRVALLRTIPGVGPITTSAIIATVGSGKQFNNGREFAAWLGLTPLNKSSGGENVWVISQRWAQIYNKTGNLHAVQLLLGHTKMDSTVRYLGVDLEDALAISESVEI